MTDHQMNRNDGTFQICSPEYLNFYRAVGGFYASDYELVEAIRREIPGIARLMNIGRLYLRIQAPTSIYSPAGQVNEDNIYVCEEGYDEEAVCEFPFETGERGSFLVLFCPIKGYRFTGMDMPQLAFLASNLFAMCSRIRMLKLLNTSLVTDMMTTVMNINGITQHSWKMKEKGTLADHVGVFFNLKNFKYINQMAGGRQGDELIIKYSKTLMSRLKDDERIARPGGDNFFALIHKDHVDEFLSLLSELPVTLSFEEGERTFLISAHAGLYAIMPGDDLTGVLNKATIALNAAKNSGQAVDHMWYNSSLQDRIMHQKQVSQLFPRALRNKEFVVYYQPKVSLEDGSLCGCEALVRWKRGEEIVPPMQFIPVLESEGTICSLDFYVFDRVCSDLRDWIRQGIEPVRVSVNFSQQHLHSSDLAERIEAIMEFYEIDSRYIEVELTELSGVKNHDSMMEFLKKMHEKGICTSIDDFGTGYSSLNMLREFDMDIIKLDKSFLDRIANDNPDYRSDEVVVENIVHMAQSLELEIISEGVETVHQADFLKHIHCDMAQGFLFDRPLPHDVFEHRLTGSRVYEIPQEA